MTLSARRYSLWHRLRSGLVAGMIVGMILGTGFAIRIAQLNSSLYSAYLQAQLRLHLGIIYALIMMVAGLIVGAFVLGRRRRISLVSHGVIVLLSLALFYYVRNRLSIHIFAGAGNLRWLAEIIGSILWGVVCWIAYRVLVWLEEHAKGWIVRACAIVASGCLVWSIIPLVWVPSVRLTRSSPILPAPNPDTKVAVIGIDGAWWEIIDPLIQQGRMPVFQHLIERGIRSNLQTLLPTESPRIWTTIATGKVPEKHHITSFTVWKFAITDATLPITRIPESCEELNWMQGFVFQVMPINSTFRKSEAVWDILSDAGLSVGVLNWWASYPAEPVNGYIVSDHALYNRVVAYDIGVKGKAESYTVFPPQLLAELTPLNVEPEDVPVDSVARFIHFRTPQDRDWYINTSDYQLFDRQARASLFKFAYPEDKTMINVALHMLKSRPQPDFFAIYLNGMDPIEHFYLPYYFHERHEGHLLQENVDRLKDLVPEYAVFLDEAIGQIVATLDSNTTVVVVSDHGFDHQYYPGGRYEHSKAPAGVLIMSGNDIRHGETISASVKDITPTILSLFGLPVGRDMDGRVLTEAMEGEGTPVEYVDTYDTKLRDDPRAEPSRIDAALEERYRALGYVK